MEKLPGVRLDVVWSSMEIGDRLAIVKAIARYQKAWMSVSFKQFGGLYYTQDLDEHTQSPLYFDQHGVAITDPRFAIGPSTGREFIDDERAAIEFDRGPCRTHIQILVPIRLTLILQGTLWKNASQLLAIEK